MGILSSMDIVHNFYWARILLTRSMVYFEDYDYWLQGDSRKIDIGGAGTK